MLSRLKRLRSRRVWADTHPVGAATGWVLAVMLLSVIAPAALFAEPIEISTVNYPPFVSEKPYEKIGHGLMADITTTMFERAGYRADLVYLPHKRSSLTFINGRYPFTLNSLKTLLAAGLTPEQFESISLGFYNAYFFYLKSHLKRNVVYKTYSDLQGYSVCVTRGSYISEPLRNAGVMVDDANTSYSCMEKLLLRRNHMWGSVDLTAHFLMKRHHPEAMDDFTHAPAPEDSFGARDEIVLSHRVSNSSAAQLAVKLNRAFTGMKKDGTLIAIMQRYWGDCVPGNVLPLDMQ
jgi:polar amino acid transport system substrate-binding protein